MGVPISNVTRRVVYAASGTGPYNFTFEILAAGDVAVYRDDTLLTITTDYTVTINSNGTGFITLVASPTGATQISIVGNRAIQRTTDFVTGGDFFANTVNDEMDQQTIFAQQNAEGLQRALQAPQTDPTSINMTLPRASVRANKTLAFDTNGNPTTGEVIGDNRGNWASGIAYNKRDIVKDTSNGNVYYANTSHTSTGAQPISTNADSAKWDLIVDNASAGASATAAAASASAAATSASNASTSATNAASSASTASTQASNASTSATNAANSATAAASSASTASTAATNAGNSATAAATSATNASNSASAASTSASNASTSATSAANSATTATTQATNASNSASSASTSASNASTSATNAANSASSASTSATNASNSATAAAGSATSAAASAASAAASLDNFDDRYLGPKSSNPTVDNDGDPLVTGALYYRTTAPIGMKVWDGSQWLEASAAQQASFVTYEYIATAGQTTFTGNDANGVALSYIQGGVVVSINGVVQNPGDDYTATNGTSIVLTVGAALNDEIMVLAFRTFEVANTYTQAQADSRFVRTDGGNGVTLASGNLGLGVTPSAWGSVSKAIQMSGGMSLFSNTSGLGGVGNNVYSIPGTGDYYIANGFATRYYQFNGQHVWNVAPSGTAGNAISFTQAMTLDASGNLGVGTTSPSALGLQVSKGSGVAAGLLLSNANNNWSISCGASTNALIFTDNQFAERARITSGGLFLCGTTSAPTSIAGTIGAVGYATRSGVAGGSFSGNNFNINWTGSAALWIDNTNLGNIQLSSDYRIKKNIETQTAPALERVMRLRPVTYELADYGNLFKADGVQREGFIAHEVQEVIPSGAEGQKDEEGRIQNLRTDAILSVAVKAIQEQQAIINQLKADVAALKGAA